MRLMAIGKLIQGQSHQSGRRVCLVDRDVETITGLPIDPVQMEMAQTKEGEDGEQQSKEGSETHGSEGKVEKASRSTAVEGEPSIGEATKETKKGVA
jgi:hypothetical protein